MMMMQWTSSAWHQPAFFSFSLTVGASKQDCLYPNYLPVSQLCLSNLSHTITALTLHNPYPPPYFLSSGMNRKALDAGGNGRPPSKNIKSQCVPAPHVFSISPSPHCRGISLIPDLNVPHILVIEFWKIWDWKGVESEPLKERNAFVSLYSVKRRSLADSMMCLGSREEGNRVVFKGLRTLRLIHISFLHAGTEETTTRGLASQIDMLPACNEWHPRKYGVRPLSNRRVGVYQTFVQITRSIVSHLASAYKYTLGTDWFKGQTEIQIRTQKLSITTMTQIIQSHHLSLSMFTIERTCWN